MFDNFRRVNRSFLPAFIRRCRWAFAGVAVLSAIANMLALTGSLYMLQVYDRVLPSRSMPTLVGLTILMIGIYAAFGVLDLLRSRVVSRPRHPARPAICVARSSLPSCICRCGPQTGITRFNLFAISIKSAISSPVPARSRSWTCPGCRSIWSSFSFCIPCLGSPQPWGRSSWWPSPR